MNTICVDRVIVTLTLNLPKSLHKYLQVFAIFLARIRRNAALEIGM
jgi:hypothetical protein